MHTATLGGGRCGQSALAARTSGGPSEVVTHEHVAIPLTELLSTTLPVKKPPGGAGTGTVPVRR
jgi:hypothetical protein